MAAAVVVGGSLLGVAGATASGAGKHDSATLYVAVTHTVGSTLYAAGNSTDKLLGRGAITYTIKAGLGSKAGTIKTTGTVATYGAGGELSGKVSGLETTKANGTVTETGKFDFNKGTGAEKRHSYVGTYSGTGKTAVGPFVFHAKGIFK
ncbi:MAG: hypothetical protein ABI323_12480 [Solirubrobacteraceae bacterium]